MDFNTAQLSIVGALSATVNNCMKEMGYFPGMFPLYQETRQENNRLRDEVNKLYSDNINLSRMINEQKERITSLTSRPPVERDIEMESLRKQVRDLVVERDAAVRSNNQMCVCYLPDCYSC